MLYGYIAKESLSQTTDSSRPRNSNISQAPAVIYINLKSILHNKV